MSEWHGRLLPVRFGSTLGLLAVLHGWMLAALRAPSLGATGLAKESLRWLAIPAAGALVVGGCLAVISELLLGRAGSSKGATP
jgi:hypothetical protein